MLDGKDSLSWHFAQNAALILLSLLFLPIDTLFLCFSLSFEYVLRQWSKRPVYDHARRRTVLITGVGMTKGLALARSFHAAGHRVIGADFEENGALVCGRVSRALASFYSLQNPSNRHGSSQYVKDLTRIIREEKIELWVSCSGVASAVEDGEAKEAIEKATTCRAVQFDVAQTSMLHEKHSFINKTHDLGLTVPHTFHVTDHTKAEKLLLDASRPEKYIMKCVGVDDSTRGDMTLLPCRDPQETRAHLAEMNISSENPWIIQQYIKGKEYCTHALVVGGVVKLFVACPSLELLMHYEALPADSPLSQAMLKFTKVFATDGGHDFTGHISFDFLVENSDGKSADDIVLYPIECNPRAHTAVALFNRTPAMVDAYLSLLAPAAESSEQAVITPVDPGRYHWIGHDLVTDVVLPIIHGLGGRGPTSDIINGIKHFYNHLLFWKDGTFEVRDPLPWWWLYHVYWPMQFLNSILYRTKWSRVNVSTTKMFVC